LTTAVSVLTMARMITRAQAVALYDNSVRALQSALGLRSHASIYMWHPDEPIPEVHYLRLRYQLKPEAFDKDGRYIGPAPRGGRDAA
jgi:hypothetical protein